MKLGFFKLNSEAIIPTRAYYNDLGFDLYALENTIIFPGMITKVRTGIAIQFPELIGGLIRDRSSVATKQEVFVVAGVIDPQYTGEIIVAFSNPLHRNVMFEHGQKIAQLILIHSIECESEEIETIHQTIRSNKGFGSSGM